MEPLELENRRFSKSLMGANLREVKTFTQDAADEMRRLSAENAGLKKDIQGQEKELHEFRERENTIRNVLVTAQKTAEQARANAEKEAKLIVSEAELRAENILEGARRQLAQTHEEIEVLKRHRIQLEAKMKSLLETFRQILDAEKVDFDSVSEVKPAGAMAAQQPEMGAQK